MRSIGVVTGSRADYGIYLPIMRRMLKDPELRLVLFVTGMHLSPDFGLTVDAIKADGFEISEQIEMLLSSDSPEGIAKSMGLGAIGFSQAYSRTSVDLLLVLGDRFEMLAAVVAALPFNIPIAHIHGGEITEGAIDDCIRHAITKMSHLHFVATDEYRQRVIQMGEQPSRVIVSGAPTLDNLSALNLMNREEIERVYGLSRSSPFLLVTYHPVTLDHSSTQSQITEVISALEATSLDVFFTYPNADTSSRTIVREIQEATQRSHRMKVANSIGTRAYFSLMSHAAAMVGNSSSGIIEAASFRLPVVNIGSRQKGRTRPTNVIDVECNREGIEKGIRRALSGEYRQSLETLINPFGDGRASERIVATLKSVDLNTLIHKQFHEG
ncbi:MAG TPA: UDP-N-acetylglucosamine 2-epimerase [Terriglobia bacterium]|nr:UDP-N-acetylglucosamine 2-epimerase [Terriglobia bacterium]